MTKMNPAKHIIRLTGILFAGLILSFPASAQKVGSTSMQFLHVMPSARATAMGDAYSVLASGAEAVNWNPGGVALVKGHEFSSTYIDWIYDSKQVTLSYAGSLGDIGAIGFQLEYVDYGEFDESRFDVFGSTEGPYLTGNTFHPFSYLVGVTYARSMTDRFSVGLGVKYAHESLFNGQAVTAMLLSKEYGTVNTWADALLFDFGLRYNTGYRSVQIGASIQNFGADVTFAQEATPVPLLFRLGIASDLIGNDALLMNEEGHRLTTEFDLFQPNDYAQQAHLGLEYEFASTFALRIGYKFNYDNEDLTFGAGVKQDIGSTKFSVDYSYGSVGTYLGYVQRISLGVSL